MARQGIVLWTILIITLIYFQTGCFCLPAHSSQDWETNGRVPYQRINAVVSTPDAVASKQAKSDMLYECKRETCLDGVCKTENYHGTSPPEWCGASKPHKLETKCIWNQTCSEFQPCQVQSSNCKHKYEDLIGSGRNSTFNFDCSEELCSVAECMGEKCLPKVTMSLDTFQENFVTKLPNCRDVENSGAGRFKRGAPPSVQALIGYCCEIGERWNGIRMTKIRPIIS